jgi:hypothetical protein
MKIMIVYITSGLLLLAGFIVKTIEADQWKEQAYRAMKAGQQAQALARDALDTLKGEPITTNTPINWNLLMQKFEQRGFSNVWISVEAGGKRVIFLIQGTNAVIGKVTMQTQPEL